MKYLIILAIALFAVCMADEEVRDKRGLAWGGAWAPGVWGARAAWAPTTAWGHGAAWAPGVWGGRAWGGHWGGGWW